MDKSIEKMSDRSSDSCYGCGTCVASCKQGALTLVINEKGFLLPQIDRTACNSCGLCVQVCPAINTSLLNRIQGRKPFALQAGDSTICLLSSSGGVALEIALTYGAKGYNIIGAVYNKHFRTVEHVIAQNAKAIITTSGSKYVQSNASNAFSEALKDPVGKYVVFGTPCQIDGLRNAIMKGNLYNNYILVDFFCLGVPSYRMWWKFIEGISSKVGDLEHLDLRNKTEGWQSYKVFAVGSKGIYLRTFSSTVFGRFYLSKYFFRESCYTCKYRKFSAADIRLGDFWGPGFSHDYLGTSIALPFTSKGYEMIEQTKGLSFRSVPNSWLAKSQVQKIQRPDDNNDFVQEILCGKNFYSVYRKYLALKYLKIALKGFTYKVASAILPRGAKKVIRFIMEVGGRKIN
jgi:coenzyme F420-reducing hydrogenase beta subunit